VGRRETAAGALPPDIQLWRAARRPEYCGGEAGGGGSPGTGIGVRRPCGSGTGKPAELGQGRDGANSNKRTALMDQSNGYQSDSTIPESWPRMRIITSTLK